MANNQLQIYDRLRQKYVMLTPEEWVRQHFVNFLISHRNYSPGLMANEVGIRHNGCLRRCDTIIYDHSAKPLAIVEYKAPSIEISAMVFDQIVRYNMVLGVKFLIVSNGINHFCCYISSAGADKEASPSYIFLRDIPTHQYMEDYSNGL